MRERDEPYDGVLAGAGYVTQRLRLKYGDVQYAGNQRTLHVWRIRIATGRTLVVRFANAALAGSRTQIDEWIAGVTEPSRFRELPVGAYYHVSPGGIHVMGVDEIGFEKHGQVIRCVIDPGPPPVWRLSVDGADRGASLAVDPDQAQDEVARMSVEWLYVNGHLRVPPPPWSWSVVDASGDEWWVRLELEGGPGTRPGRSLVLFERRTERQHRVGWDLATSEPSARELRDVIERLGAEVV